LEAKKLTLLQFENVTFINDQKNILNDINFDIYAGDFISIVGPSGSGKSTLLKLCCHLISPSSGRILYKDKEITDYNPTEIRKEIAYCFQTPSLFGETVLDNLKFPYQIRNIKYDEERVKELFQKFQLDIDLVKNKVKNLSGGEKQRIALIRILLYKPQIILLDEITSALDVDNTLIVESVIESLNDEGITILWITHNPEQSRKYANKVLTIEQGAIKSMEMIK
jgi:putative ABC transport system ATP-binding protein